MVNLGRYSYPLRLMLAVAILPLGASAEPAPQQVTLQSGYFDDFLMLAADTRTGVLSGYYNDGSCKLFFRGPLRVVELPQRSDFGEAYMPEIAPIDEPGRVSPAELYSRAKNGFTDQITLEPNLGPDAGKCRRRITLDRASHVSGDYIEVRVLRKKGARLYQVERTGGEPRLTRDRNTPSPDQDAGVWVPRKALGTFDPPGFQYATWYGEQGQTLGAYIRDSDLYPVSDG